MLKTSVFSALGVWSLENVTDTWQTFLEITTIVTDILLHVFHYKQSMIRIRFDSDQIYSDTSSELLEIWWIFIERRKKKKREKKHQRNARKKEKKIEQKKRSAARELSIIITWVSSSSSSRSMRLPLSIYTADDVRTCRFFFLSLSLLSLSLEE